MFDHSFVAVAGSAAAAASNFTLSNILDVVLIVGGILSVLGIGVSAWGAYKNAQKQQEAEAVRNSKIDAMIASQPTPRQQAEQDVRNVQMDKVINAFLGDETHPSIPTRLLTIETAVSPNGKNTDHLADRMARMEDVALPKLTSDVAGVKTDIKGVSIQLSTHIEQQKQVDLAQWVAIAGDAPSKKGKRLMTIETVRQSRKYFVLLCTSLTLMFGLQVTGVLETRAILNADHAASTKNTTLQDDIAKALFVEVGDGVEENVAFRNEMCAILEHLKDNPMDIAIAEYATKQCAIPFKAPIITVNGSGKITNKTGLPPGD